MNGTGIFPFLILLPNELSFEQNGGSQLLHSTNSFFHFQFKKKMKRDYEDSPRNFLQSHKTL